MITSVEALIRRHEGTRTRRGRHVVYTDTRGIETIGIGRNLRRGLTDAEAELLFANDLEEHYEQLHLAIPWVGALDEVRHAVLVDMAYNLGVPGLLKFKRTLASVHDGRYADAAREMLESRWAGQVGTRATRLARMMRSGEWPIR